MNLRERNAEKVGNYVVAVGWIIVALIVAMIVAYHILLLVSLILYD
jgi:hypothetical protein